jgi:hypothetical protein
VLSFFLRIKDNLGLFFAFGWFQIPGIAGHVLTVFDIILLIRKIGLLASSASIS